MLAIILNLNFKTIKQVKTIGFDKELNNITNKLPENKIICEEILKKLKNENVKIKEEPGNQASLYIIMTNSIIIANIKNTFTRIQTIAHECIHSIQDKRILWFNFIFSNIYMIYFFVITILAIFNKTSNTPIYLVGLIIAGIVFYFIRSYLEIDAMTKAYYEAEKYLISKQEITQEERKLICEKYEYLNKIGIKAAMFSVFVSILVKIIIFSIANLI